MKPQPATSAVVSTLLLLAAKTTLNHRQRGIQHAVSKSPFVITPDQRFDQVFATDSGLGAINDGAVWIVVKIDRNQR